MAMSQFVCVIGTMVWFMFKCTSFVDIPSPFAIQVYMLNALWDFVELDTYPTCMHCPTRFTPSSPSISRSFPLTPLCEYFLRAGRNHLLWVLR